MNPQVQLMIGENDKPHVQGSNYGVSNGEQLKIGNSIVKTVHVPCHTRGHTIFSFLPLQENFIDEYPKLSETTI